MYKVTISDGIALTKCIEHITFNVDNSRNSIIITGNIDTEDNILALYKWSLLSGANPDCYKEITVEQYSKNRLLRKVHFSKVFVVDYSESYSNYSGIGKFTIYIRQFCNKDIDVNSDELNLSTNHIIENCDNIKVVVESGMKKTESDESSLVAKSNRKVAISFTDRLVKQSKIQDFSNVSDEKLNEIFAKEIEQSKEAYKRAIKVKQQTKKKGCVASNGKVTLSGYGEKVKSSKDFTHVPLETIFEYCKNIGHELPSKVPSSFDNGIKGSFLHVMLKSKCHF